MSSLSILNETPSASAAPWIAPAPHQELGVKWKNQQIVRQARNPANRQDRQRGLRLFNPDKPNRYQTHNRWEGYTDDHCQGAHNRYNHNSRQRPNREAFDREDDRLNSGSSQARYQDRKNQDRTGQKEHGGTQRYSSDDFYYSDHDIDRRNQHASNRRPSSDNRDMDRERMREDRMPRAMEQNCRQHARGRARFYRDQPEDSGRMRQFDRGPGQDQYYESTTRHSSRGYNE
ncbi:MAG: hypothetical protein WD425_11915 [Nitrospirales bacterium]